MTTKPESAADNGPDKELASRPEESASGDVSPENKAAPANPDVEIGGRDGPDPTRYGDWEKNGRCIDF